MMQLWKAELKKWEIERQRDKQIKQKNKLDLKYQQKIRRIKKLSGQKTYWIEQDDKLRTTISDLQNQINNHNCSGCHIPTHNDYGQLKTETNNLSIKYNQLDQDYQNLNELYWIISRN